MAEERSGFSLNGKISDKSRYDFRMGFTKETRNEEEF